VPPRGPAPSDGIPSVVDLRDDGFVDYAAAGLGLQYGTVRLVPTDPSWAAIGHDLATETKQMLGELVRAVEHVGSTSVPGLLAKRVMDLALGVPVGADVEELVEPMSQRGWIYRGDGGVDGGGWVFVLEDSPWHRVAHAHGVIYGGDQWLRYLEFREVLRGDEL